MKSKILIIFFISVTLLAQTVVTTVPQYPTETDNITITFDVTNANPTDKPTLSGYNSGDAYAHTGVTVRVGTGSNNRWRHVIESWGNNATQPKLTRIGINQYQLVINNPRTYYPNILLSEKIVELCFVIRSADANRKTEDIFVPLYESGITVVVNSPIVSVSYGDPMRSPVFTKPGETVNISASAASVGTTTASMKIFVNGTEKVSTTTNSIEYQFVSDQYSAGRNDTFSYLLHG